MDISFETRNVFPKYYVIKFHLHWNCAANGFPDIGDQGSALAGGIDNLWMNLLRSGESNAHSGRTNNGIRRRKHERTGEQTSIKICHSRN